ncbi:hypothetical protein V0M98_35350 (plasmid) [Pseudomonas silesiensis]|uniref:hypothetical protein n=1 Tax=Pseudomonas silesiensis TaxID=1853130 RepID=UPI0030CEDDA2
MTDEQFNNLVNFLNDPQPYGVVFEDEFMVTMVDPEVLRTVAANFKGTINGESPEKYLAVRDENDDLVSLAPLRSDYKDIMSYPAPSEVEPGF